MKFDINKYKSGCVMHCKTETEAKDFCNYLHNIGRRWYDGESYAERTMYDKYQENTAYNFNAGGFGRVAFYRDMDYTILEWEDFMDKKFTKADLKTGDIILRRDGDVEILIKEFDVLIRNDGEYNELRGIKEDLTSFRSIDRDVIAVRRPTDACHCVFSAFDYNRGTLVYERKEPEAEEMTLAEVCKLLGKEIKIIQ